MPYFDRNNITEGLIRKFMDKKHENMVQQTLFASRNVDNNALKVSSGRRIYNFFIFR